MRAYGEVDKRVLDALDNPSLQQRRVLFREQHGFDASTMQSEVEPIGDAHGNPGTNRAIRLLVDALLANE